jgi:hypothetical protein
MYPLEGGCMGRVWGTVLSASLAVLILVGCDDEDKKAASGFERIGGEANAHFVYLDQSRYGQNKKNNKDMKSLQMRDSRRLCREYGNDDYCDVYIWTDRKEVADSLPLRQRDAQVGWFAMRDGKMSYFKEVNQEEIIADAYGRDTEGKVIASRGDIAIPQYTGSAKDWSAGPEFKPCKPTWSDWWRGRPCGTTKKDDETDESLRN